MLQEADAIISILSPFFSSSSEASSVSGCSSSVSVLNAFKALSLYSQAVNHLLIPSSSTGSSTSPYPNESYRLAAKNITQLLVPSQTNEQSSTLPLVSIRFFFLPCNFVFSGLPFLFFFSCLLSTAFTPSPYPSLSPSLSRSLSCCLYVCLVDIGFI
jgi:hypothetical protein